MTVNIFFHDLHGKASKLKRHWTGQHGVFRYCIYVLVVTVSTALPARRSEIDNTDSLRCKTELHYNFSALKKKSKNQKGKKKFYKMPSQFGGGGISWTQL